MADTLQVPVETARHRILWLVGQLEIMAFCSNPQTREGHIAFAQRMLDFADEVARSVGGNRNDDALRVTLWRFAFDLRGHTRLPIWTPIVPIKFQAMADALRSLVALARTEDAERGAA